MDNNIYTPFELWNILQNYIWLLLGPIFPCLDREHVQRTQTQIS